MQNLQEVVIAIVAFIVLVGVMVVVHEFGHFAVAKLFKVRVEAFSFGFGPRLFGFKYGETDYKVCLLPLGGFVKMTGENFSEVGDAAAGEANIAPPDDPGAFTSHPRWQRMLIGLAGPFSNFVLAFVLMLGYFYWVNEVPKFEVKTTTVEWVVPGTPAAQAGFAPGDIVRRFDSVDNPDWMQVELRATVNQNQTVPVTVDRDGKTLQLSLRIPSAPKGEEFDLGTAGLIEQMLPGPIGVKDVSPNSPAAQAGLVAGDAIQTVDGHAFHTVESLLYYLQSGQGKPVTLIVLRNGVTLSPIVVHPAILESAQAAFPWKLGFTPADFPVRTDPLPFSKAVTRSKAFCAENSFLIVEVLGRLFTHKVSISQLSGPVGIARMAGQAAQMKDLLPKIGLAAAISLNLGILNLLPFPILDGGMILLLLIESLIRRDISIVVKERIYQAAFVVLLAFFAFVIFNDVTKLPIFTHLKP
jgi:regulator of sigma E protease